LRVHAVYDATRRDNTIATVTELCTGSHLHSSIPYPEPRAKKIIAQILDALQYMHQRKIFHNSLTTENSTSFRTILCFCAFVLLFHYQSPLTNLCIFFKVLFQDDSQDAMIKITYAGVANLPSQSNSSTSKHSNRFVIPEWNPSGKDIYSVGMIAYNLLSGGKEPPTDMDTQRVVPGTNLFMGRRWKLISISKNAKNFIERCLHSWDMKPQFTVEDALQHIWIIQEHVHRSDTSRSTETVKEMVVAKWNDVGSSLTASEPAVFHSTNETLPVVSLTAEQYARDVKSRATINDDSSELISNGDHDDNNFPVFVNEAVLPDTDPMDKVAEEIVTGEIKEKMDESTVQEDAASTVPQDLDIDDSKVPDDTAKTFVATGDDAVGDTFGISDDEMNTTNDEEIDQNDAVIVSVNTNKNSDSIIPDKLDDLTPYDTSETHTPDEFVELRDVFQEVTTGPDNDDNTPVTMETFKERLRTKYTEEEVNSWFTGHEKYEDPKTLDYKVFLRKVIQNRKSIEIQRVDNAFKLIDKGKHGYVTVGNLRAVLGKDNTENIEQLIKDADTRRDGKISYENFERVVQNYLSTVT
jgi:Ca2+-binding EF-hand superfamily protein